MSQITVTVRRTAGSGSGASHGDVEGRMTGRALGLGNVPDTFTEDARPLDALVLMSEPALLGLSLTARPVGLLHLEIDGAVCDEVLCAGERDARALGDLAHPESNEPLCEAVRRLHPNHWCVVRGGQDTEHAEQVLDQARGHYQRLTGALDY
jgi:inorganic pyrophosphatase